MKTIPVQQKIIQNFKQLKQIAEEPITRHKNHPWQPIWGLNYHKNKTNVYVAETGYITRNNANNIILL